VKEIHMECRHSAGGICDDPVFMSVGSPRPPLLAIPSLRKLRKLVEPCG
jgi:hypothetical protein